MIICSYCNTLVLGCFFLLDAFWKGRRVILNSKNTNNKLQRISLAVVLTLPLLLNGSYASAVETALIEAAQASSALQPNSQMFILHPAYRSDLATLTAEDKKRLADIAKQFTNKTIVEISVSGHTDSSIIRARSQGLYADNYVLSQSRAQNVADYLKQLLKLDDAKIQVSGRGPDVPIASNATVKGRATNRRVELVIRAIVNEPVSIIEAAQPEPAVITDGFTLQSAVKKALASNPDILIQVNERRSRNEEVERAKSGYLPTLDLNAGIGSERSRNSSTRASGSDYRTLTRQEGSISARQMLFDGFATKNEVERQQARVSSTAYTVQGVAENTALDAAEAYLNLLRNDTLLKLAKENLDAHQRTYDQIKIRSDAGVGRRADLEQISGRLALANSNLIAAQSNYDDGLTTYIKVIGEMPSGTPIKPQKQQNGIPSSRDEAIKFAIDKHPTLKSAVADVEAAMAQHRASRNTFYPRFDLELSQSWNKDLDGQLGTNNDSQAMVRMRYNLLNGGGDAARKRQTAHLIDEAKEVRNRTYRQVVETMRLSWNAYDATERQLIYLDEHVKATVRTRDAYQKQFNIGQRTLLDLLNAENELFQAKQSYISADFDNLFARYRILNAEGELLKSLNITLPKEASLKQQ